MATRLYIYVCSSLTMTGVKDRYCGLRSLFIEDYASIVCTHQNNEGPSPMVSLWSFPGGGLWIYDSVHGTGRMTVTHRITGPPELQVGWKAAAKGDAHSLAEQYAACKVSPL